MKANQSRSLLSAAGLAATLASVLVSAPLGAQVLTFPCGTSGGVGCRSQIPDARRLSPPTVLPGVLNSTITVPPGTCGGALADVDLTYRYYHGFRGDLSFQLLPPSGPAVGVDAAAAPTTSSADDFDETQPVFRTSFPTVLGQPGNGVWTLRATDSRNSNEGALGDWILTIVCQTGTQVLPTVSVAALAPNASEAPNTTGSFIFTRNLVTGNPLTVTFTLGGTASGADYAPIPLTVVIPANQASATVIVDPVSDGNPEPPETVVATVSDVPEYDPGASAQATVTIQDVGASDAIPAAGPFGLGLLALALVAVGFALLRGRP